ncbi:holo-ACP synthase [Enterovibrio norvegicus FF-33]|uniref:Holo-[acyl-carrier-protein] synthase n=1 Tax=Enterovibrio norvegicus FF-454 TaxID=1185651 RepID=A0A1E5C8B5_9GAMM|nr:holo-ACP synthase [Enterovibrio norvegicus]OEE61705.1 holo-ACP synthase [Enterovibrio norvegicus FF-454]OEE66502.1 holo-ACP synthase [Enterovibrio norvegicus FF-33]OEE88807.1 holo-ACP synthase [Enterovibrio norvegicus FF-162]
MAVVGLGTDIVEIARLEKVIARTEDAFARRVLTDSEMEKYSSSKFPARYLAKRFAVKEAAAKALGTGIACGVTFHDFTVSNDELGKPIVSFSGVAKQLADERGVTHVLLTIADEKRYAVATVLLDK